jgi:hypothetical protein
MNIAAAILTVFLVIGLDSWFVYATRVACNPLRAFLVTVCMPARMLMFLLGYLKHCVFTLQLPRRLFAADFWGMPCVLFWAAWDGYFVGMPIVRPE